MLPLNTQYPRRMPLKPTISPHKNSHRDLDIEQGQTWSDGAVEALLHPITNFPPGSNRLNVTEKTN